MLAISPAIYAGDKKNAAAEAIEDNKEIHWLTLDEAQVKMKEAPRKLYMDVYTDWCGWCKKMDKTTFENPDVIKYMNEKFYAVKFNAEQQQDVRFLGKIYSYQAEQRCNELAAQLMGGRMSYPTSIIMMENFQNPQPIPGYQDVRTIEMLLKYLGDNIYQTKKFDVYQKEFTPTWKVVENVGANAPAGH
jgi:thioredoxin-related protein